MNEEYEAYLFEILKVKFNGKFITYFEWNFWKELDLKINNENTIMNVDLVTQISEVIDG